MPTISVLFQSAYVGGLVAVIIALHVWGGFPLFFHKLDAIARNDEFSKLHKQLAWLFPALLAPWLAMEFAPPLFFASAFPSLGIFAWVIWQIRKLVATRQPATMNHLVLAL